MVLDLRGISTFTDFFVICSATSEPHLKAIAGEVETKLKQDHSIRATAIDGFPASQWIVLDYLQVIVHVFHQAKRAFYSLEDLWSDAPRLEWDSTQSRTQVDVEWRPCRLQREPERIARDTRATTGNEIASTTMDNCPHRFFCRGSRAGCTNPNSA